MTAVSDPPTIAIAAGRTARLSPPAAGSAGPFSELGAKTMFGRQLNKDRTIFKTVAQRLVRAGAIARETVAAAARYGAVILAGRLRAPVQQPALVRVAASVSRGVDQTPLNDSNRT